MAWIGLYRPEHNEVASLASEFELHELAIEDAIVAHQRPQLERYGATLLHTCPAPPRERTRSVAAGTSGRPLRDPRPVVDGYYPAVAGVGNDIDEIETEVFSGDSKVSRRIYELSREVTE